MATDGRHDLAAVTMVHNEPDFLPIWAAHYARQVGEAHCYVIDHGSTEGLEQLAAMRHVMRLPRSPMNEVALRAGLTRMHRSARAVSLRGL